MMELKIKINKGSYALRTFDKEGTQIFYTSTRIGGLSFDKESLACTIPDVSANYELTDLSKYQIVKSGKINEEKETSGERTDPKGKTNGSK
jgi:hypothetical protein